MRKRTSQLEQPASSKGLSCGWGDGLAVKSISYSLRGLKIFGVSQPSGIPAQEDPTSSSVFYRHLNTCVYTLIHKNSISTAMADFV